jgi:outer membrane lipoprotein-sorting protein
MANKLISRRAFLGNAALGIGLLAAGQIAGPLLSAAHAQGAQTAQRIADHFSSVKTMMGEFVQFGPKGEQTGGKFYIERPGKVRFDYEAPATFRVTADGRNVLLQNTKLKTMDAYPLSQTPLKLLLDNKIDLSGGRVRAVKEEADPSSYELRQWTITDAQGKETTVMIFNVEQGMQFDPSVFRIDYAAIDASHAQ